MHEEYQYLNLLKKIIEKGSESENRTNVNTIKLFGETMRFDLSDNKIPVFTTKKVYFKGVIHELLWFMRGDTNVKYLQDNDVHIWDLDADRFAKKMVEIEADRRIKNGPVFQGKKDRDEWEKTVYAEYYGDLGPIYGKQWRNFCGIDQLKYAIEELQSNPNNRRIIVNSWNPIDLPQMGLPPCFVKGSYVRTERGYKDISEISINDKIFDDKDNIQNINKIYKTKYDGNILKIKLWYNCKEILCTENHPFLNKNKEYTEAKEFKNGDFLCFKKNKTKEVLPKFIFDYGNQYDKWGREYSPSKEDMFVFGYFVGDGWVCSGDYRCCFYVNKKQKEEILPKIRDLIKVSLKKNNREDLTEVETYETRNKNLYNIFSQFGHKAHNKKIPNWVFDLPKDYIESFIDGFKKADGVQSKKELVFTTTSPSLAYGFSKLLSTLDKNASIRFQEKEKETEICGRKVNQKDLFYFEENSGDYIEKDDEYFYIPIFKIEKIKTSSLKNYDGYVYNLDIENSHTYTINNISNHNCHILFQFGVEDNKYLTCAMYQRSCDFGLGVPFNVASYSLLTHIIAKATGLEAKEFIWFGFDCHIYDTHRKALLEQISRKPFEFPTIEIDEKVTNAGIDILNNNFLKYSDFTLKNYKSYPPIKMDLADY